MPRPDPRAPHLGQDPLFTPTESTAESRAGGVLRGRHSVSVDKALDAARDRAIVTEVDEAAATLLRAGAWSLDAFESQNKPYGPSKIIPAMTEALRELHMTPESRKSNLDPDIAGLIESMAALDSDDDDASVPHAQE